MKKILITGLLILLFFMIDNTLVPLVPLFHIKNYSPSLLLVFVLCFSIINGKWQGLWAGVAAGMLQDIFFYNSFGINSFINMIVCVIAGGIGINIFKNKRLIPMVSTLGLSVLKGCSIYTILLILGQHANSNNIVFNGIYDMCICIFMYKPIYKLYHKDFLRKDWKF